MAKEIGFLVQVLKPDRTTELAKIYRTLNASDVMIGVHGAAMTHFLFLRPGSVFIQVVPLGTTWPAETHYGEPARKLGLKYIGYQIHPKESTLYESTYEGKSHVTASERDNRRCCVEGEKHQESKTNRDLSKVAANNTSFDWSDPITGTVSASIADIDFIQKREGIEELNFQFKLPKALVPKWCIPPDVQATNIIVNPGLTFGTGEHATTRLCLLLLHGCIKGGEHILDYVTGTGIPAIAALKAINC
ncbi:hypothetical protein VNO78_06462 [Psophocarpus tetragonolobus]|uniref:Glycosyltransferase n=1 Tax=Psophocarpus tetragonolobus TaxID=3891 RepID=A0AAN9XR63_PSOTE